MVVENHLVSDEKVELIRKNPWLCTSPFWQTQIKERTGKTNWGPCCDYDVEFFKNSKETYETIENLKLLIQKKEIDKKCRTCHRLERIGGISERMRYLIDLPIEKIQNFIDNPSLLKLEKYTPVVSIKVTTTCNLACRSCNGAESSLYNKLFGNNNSNYDIWKNSEDEEFFKDYLLEKSKNSEEIILHVLGGEVFLDDYIQKILKWCEEYSIINKISLHITTNNQIPMENRLVNISKNLKSVYLSLSIDSVYENYSYVRWPGKFSKIEENLSYLEDLKIDKLKDKLTYSITPVFSLNNIFYLKDYLDYWLDYSKKNNLENLRIYNFHLHHPQYLKIENLSSTYRKNLLHIIEECSEHEIFNFLSDTIQFKEWIKVIVNNLKNETGNEESFLTYLRNTRMYDQKTNQDSFKLNSRLFNLLTEEHKSYYFKSNIIPINTKI